MKKLHFNIIVILLGFSLGFSSCFHEDRIGEEISDNEFIGEDTVYSSKNVDKIDFKKEITEEGLNSTLEEFTNNNTLGQLITAQFSMRGGKNGDMPGPHAYQYQFSLEIDNYAGYLCLPQNFDGRMSSVYYDSQSFNGGAMGSFFQMKNGVVPVLNHPKIDSIPEVKAIALLLYNYSAQEVTDIYGAFPYAELKANKETSPFKYNSAEEIYTKIVENIDTIVACFDNYSNRPDWYKEKVQAILIQVDRISNENKSLDNWKRLANSLKLRMAMHIVKVDPVKAQRWAEEAVQSGVVEQLDQEFKLSPLTIGFTHPLATISNLWNDTRLNASFESMLTSLRHPMLDFLFDINEGDIINKRDKNKFLPDTTKVIGLRTGIRMLAGQNYGVNFRTAYSKINQGGMSLSPLYIMKLSEVLFLRAEGALRGWNMGGTAESFYNEGVRSAFKGVNMNKFDKNWKQLSFEQIYGDYVEEYLGMETPNSYTYEDPYNERYTMESMTKIGVKWNSGDDNETKLEKILTQKYIAIFPYSFEAWTDIRRTGYPKIFPVLHDDGDGSIPAGDIIRRIPFTDSDPATKADIEATGLEALGGPDLQGTRIWWDVNKPNF